MMSTGRERWVEQQVRTLIGLGADPHDAESAVAWVLNHLPPGADPGHWVVPPDALMRDATIMPEDIQDARVDWYASDAIPPRFKRILDAKLDEDAG